MVGSVQKYVSRDVATSENQTGWSNKPDSELGELGWFKYFYNMWFSRIILETRSKNNITWASSCQKVPVIMVSILDNMAVLC